MDSVCILGDSVAKGVIFDSVKNKYRLLKESFANIVERQQNISVLNLARFGCTVSMGSEILKRHESELSRYDYIILEFGGNDCDYNWAEISENPSGHHLCNTPIPLFREKYKELIDRVLRNGGRPVLLNLPPIDPKRYFKWICKGLNGKNILTYLEDIEAIYKWQELYSKTVEELAAEIKVPLIDIRSGFLDKKNFSCYLCADGIHPNEKGHLLISKILNEKALS
ncbi:MAG: SGNH/GDSL hydrolase family protein [Eubacteriales bacterium]|nr:SGNH/GDSL hydrolase family protein [Eubacteriales bacterium]MDD3199207.1 SGNH/GDSL hydrolase family protein [Eubacteriales bacterium]MDD4629138.1 SGNH/GDSL hydrolase family protein [Eubacteriales bacterium]